jgi:hypothetical protein
MLRHEFKVSGNHDELEAAIQILERHGYKWVASARHDGEMFPLLFVGYDNEGEIGLGFLDEFFDNHIPIISFDPAVIDILAGIPQIDNSDPYEFHVGDVVVRRADASDIGVIKYIDYLGTPLFTIDYCDGTHGQIATKYCRHATLKEICEAYRCKPYVPAPYTKNNEQLLLSAHVPEYLRQYPKTLDEAYPQPCCETCCEDCQEVDHIRISVENVRRLYDIANEEVKEILRSDLPMIFPTFKIGDIIRHRDVEYTLCRYGNFTVMLLDFESCKVLEASIAPDNMEQITEEELNRLFELNDL